MDYFKIYSAIAEKSDSGHCHFLNSTCDMVTPSWAPLEGVQRGDYKARNVSKKYRNNRVDKVTLGVLMPMVMRESPLELCLRKRDRYKVKYLILGNSSMICV